jgi:RNA polymerase sigma factor (sigma-70 family)
MVDKEKELRLTMKLSNNRLRKRIEETKLTVPEAAELAEISYGLLCGYIALRVSPIDAEGRWKHSALELCDALTVSPDYLWPESVLTVNNPKVVVEMDAADLAPQLLSSQLHEPPQLPEQLLSDEETAKILNDALKTLSPREREVLRRRYGYDAEPLHLGEVGKTVGLCRERVRQIEARALQKLRDKLHETFTSNAMTYGLSDMKSVPEILEERRAAVKKREALLKRQRIATFRLRFKKSKKSRVLVE